jgi:hypothetical protein
MKIVVWKGRPHWAVAPRRLAPSTAVLRRPEPVGRAAVASAVLEPSRSAAPARSPFSPPRSAPRPREHRAAPRGRDGGERDDGGGGDSDGGDPDGPPGHPRADDAGGRS